MPSDASESILGGDRPDRMYRRGRPVDPVFEPAEEPYERIHHRAHAAAWSLNARFPDFSVNRQKYSEPEGVPIRNWPDWGIVGFRVDAIPPYLESGGGVIYSFQVVHEPIEDNYAYSEVHTLKGDKRNPSKVPEPVKKVFRQILAERLRLIRAPAQ